MLESIVGHTLDPGHRCTRIGWCAEVTVWMTIPNPQPRPVHDICIVDTSFRVFSKKAMPVFSDPGCCTSNPAEVNTILSPSYYHSTDKGDFLNYLYLIVYSVNSYYSSTVLKPVYSPVRAKTTLNRRSRLSLVILVSAQR